LQISEFAPIAEWVLSIGKMPVATIPTSEAYLPTWQSAPVIFGGISVKHDANTNECGEGVLVANVPNTTASVALESSIASSSPGNVASHDHTAAMTALLCILSVAKGEMVDYLGDPLTSAKPPSPSLIPSPQPSRCPDGLDWSGH
jgi:hypothetical protein